MQNYMNVIHKYNMVKCTPLYCPIINGYPHIQHKIYEMQCFDLSVLHIKLVPLKQIGMGTAVTSHNNHFRISMFRNNQINPVYSTFIEAPF